MSCYYFFFLPMHVLLWSLLGLKYSQEFSLVTAELMREYLEVDEVNSFNHAV